MIISVILNGCLGFAMLVTLLFVMGPVDGILESPFLFPFVGIFEAITYSQAGTIAMVPKLVLLDRHEICS